MINITKEELYEHIINKRDIEFTIGDHGYVMQYDVYDNTPVEVLWTTDLEDNKCLLKNELHGNNISKEFIDQFLNQNFIGDKSFMDLWSEITIDAIL